MVVMELLEGAVTWQNSMHHPVDVLRDAVEKLHGAGWVHGDIRCANVLISNERQVLHPPCHRFLTGYSMVSIITDNIR